MDLRYHVKDFSDLVECFRHGNAVLPLTDLVLDGSPLDPAWTALLVCEGKRHPFITIKTASESWEQIKNICGDFLSSKPKPFERLEATLDHTLSVAFLDGYSLHGSHHLGCSATLTLHFQKCQNAFALSMDPASASSSSLSARLPKTKLRVRNDRTTVTKRSETHGDIEESTLTDSLSGQIGCYRYRVLSEGEDLTIQIYTKKGE
ncbi:MAG: hypothetical protein Q7Q71_13350 [Verrucomicrobiota bacterium JB023]|nr:hypothetical protein [Verrucomicrobiota bacterium JB023]